MLKRRITGYTNTIRPSSAMAAVFGDSGALQIRMKSVADQPVCDTAWEPTPDEVLALAQGGSVVVSTVGHICITHASVAPAEKDEGPIEIGALNDLIGRLLLAEKDANSRVAVVANLFESVLKGLLDGGNLSMALALTQRVAAINKPYFEKIMPKDGNKA